MKTQLMLLATAAMIGATLAGPVAAQAPAEKQLRSTMTAEPVELGVAPLRKSYAIGEAISLQVELAKPAFLYIYTRENNGKSNLFNIGGAASAIAQPAGKTVLRNIFVGDAAGDEEIVVFASTERLKLPAAQNVSTRVFEAQLAELGVSVGPKARAAVQGGFSEPTSLVLKIGAPAPTTASAGFAALNSDKRSYKVGEMVQLAVGSTAKGVVQLFSRDPGKAPVLLASETFTTAGIKVIKADAALPAGEQQILAVWSADGKVTAAQLEAAGFGAEAANSDDAAKALALRDTPARPALNVTTLSITVTE